MEPQERLPEKAKQIIQEGIDGLNRVRGSMKSELDREVESATNRVKALQDLAKTIPDNLADLLAISNGQVWIERYRAGSMRQDPMHRIVVNSVNNFHLLVAEKSVVDGHHPPIIDEDEEVLIVLAVIPVKKKGD